GALGAGGRLRSAFVLDRGAWRSLPPLPQPRAAAGAAVIAGKLYVVGGVGRSGLARQAFALDLHTRRWATIPAPTPREHLAVTAARGRLYALGGRTRGFDTNLSAFEVWTPGTQRWRRLAPLPMPRGGTGAAVAAGSIVSVGGEAPPGTIASVYAYGLSGARWRRLPDLPTPRHGLGVAAIGSRVYALAGGPQPGLTVSSASEYLDLA
ncbi:MAG TPA: kelch repeat-containing protein, partial [Gaiellaceae bacterium]|nr:kelch repeat-containing protein [Gaiellaceae bacterium]